ncbi:MAG: hypothetical protein DMG38_00290 [Acidobacteria bacterium]|nr:MAG: hypothetical protein DMG38_00290 [Acidobacteriota bacterium]
MATFWPEYVRAHGQPGTRAVHLTGTLAGWLLVAAIALQRWWWIALALLVSYGAGVDLPLLCGLRLRCHSASEYLEPRDRIQWSANRCSPHT